MVQFSQRALWQFTARRRAVAQRLITAIEARGALRKLKRPSGYYPYGTALGLALRIGWLTALGAGVPRSISELRQCRGSRCATKKDDRQDENQ